jgi:ribosome-associated protein
MPAAQIREFALPESLERALLTCGEITSREARRRQLQYVGRLLRELEEEPEGAALVADLVERLGG